MVLRINRSQNRSGPPHVVWRRMVYNIGSALNNKNAQSQYANFAIDDFEQAIAKVQAEKDITELKEKNSFELRRLEAGESINSRKRRQVWRLTIAVAVVAVWLTQVAWSTYKALNDPALLDGVENIVLLVGITGVVVAVLINKVWPDNDDKKEKE